MSRLSDLARYGLWLSIAATAKANRDEYNMVTTWLPHLSMNTVSLLLPDAFRLLFPRQRETTLHLRFRRKAADPTAEALNAAQETLVTMIRDNPRYVDYVAPLAIGYLLSHPRFNIYKGKLAEIRLAGLGLDAIPHGATAFALTALIDDTVEIGLHKLPRRNLWWPLLRRIADNNAEFSLLVLGLLTFIWEFNEYRTHVYELSLRGDVTKINMQWSLRDTANDVFANFVGWGLASLLHRNLHRNTRKR